MERYILLPDGTFCHAINARIVLINDIKLCNDIENSRKFIDPHDYPFNPNIRLQHFDTDRFGNLNLTSPYMIGE